jgi:hypothetical protein
MRKPRHRHLRVREFRKDLEKLASILRKIGCFEKPVDVNQCDLAREKAKRMRVDVTRVFFRSLKQSRGRLYLVLKKQRGEVLVCFEHSSISKGEPPNVFAKATRYSIAAVDGARMSANVAPFTSENLRRLLDEELPDLLPRDMKTTPRLGLGVRMLFTLPPLLEGIKRVECLADFQLSAGREFSLTEVVQAPPGKYPEWLGHTGLNAATLYGTIAKECFKFRIPIYGTEIDHAIISPEPSTAITRIRGHVSQSGSNSSQTADVGLEDSMKYNRRIIEEATRTGFVVGITTDTSALFREEVDDVASWPNVRLRAEYESVVPIEERKAMEESYRPNTHRILDEGSGNVLELTFTEEDLMRLAVKFWLSFLANKRLHEHMVAAMNGRAFTFEISLDEAYKSYTTEKELFFCLAQSAKMGMKPDLIAPNVGFRKREDYDEDLIELEQRVRRLAAVASHFGAILDFHSGSDKRPEVYQTISKACNGKLKLKMSGIFQLEYFETLASFRPGTEERRLFERMWDYTLSYVRTKAGEGDATAKYMLQKVEHRFYRGGKPRPRFMRSPRDDFFRHYSFITVAAKSKTGRYMFRNAIYRLAEKPTVAERYNRRVIGLTAKVASALGLRKSEQAHAQALAQLQGI